MKVVSAHSGPEEERVVLRGGSVGGYTAVCMLIAGVIWLALLPGLFVDGWWDDTTSDMVSVAAVITVLGACIWLFLDRPRALRVELWSTSGLFGVDGRRFHRKPGIEAKVSRREEVKTNSMGQKRRVQLYDVCYGEDTVVAALGSRSDAQHISAWLTDPTGASGDAI